MLTMGWLCGPMASITSAEIRPRFSVALGAQTTRMSLSEARSTRLTARGQGGGFWLRHTIW